MNKRIAEQAVLQQAVNALAGATGLLLEIVHPPALADKYGPDAALKIAIPGMEGARQFAVEVINILNRASLGFAIQRLGQFQERGILVTTYVTPPIAEELRKMNIQFIDAAGNAFLNTLPLFIYIKGNKLPELRRPEPMNRAFRPAGLQVIFALLCNKGLENAPFRQIARLALVALGTVGLVMKDLKEMGYLVDMGKRGRRLTKKENLLERWVTAYPEQLRQKLTIGRFTAQNHNWWQETDIRAFHGFWGGEIAAAKATEYLKPQIATLYMHDQPGKLIIGNKLKKAADGDIEILKAFWDFGDVKTEFPDLAPPLLVYADLLATGNPRNIETAKLIYDKNIIGFIGKD
ncbi:MAG: hypothetical protein KQH63_11695 [Desulfobulbaceae bacterium]|nr:hypothetical protein [Desulfobulbaceae bacterium]